MKRLFYVVTSKGKRVSDCLESKPEAKQIRDNFGGVKCGYYVRRGPDNLPSPTGVPRMRRQPKA